MRFIYVSPMRSVLLLLAAIFSGRGLQYVSGIMVRIVLVLAIGALLFAGSFGKLHAAQKAYTLPGEAEVILPGSRLKDIVDFEGVRENMLVGYGLVVGLNGTGDKLNNITFTEKSLQAFLERQGINSRGGTQLKTKNVAAVTVTAMLPAFSRNGSTINVSVSAMGDAKSLQGGTLLATPLQGADGNVYAVAQGQLAVEGFSAQGAGGASEVKGVPTNAFIANGAIVEREIDFAMNQMDEINLALRNPDITTAKKIGDVIDNYLAEDVTKVRDPGTVKVRVPEEYRDRVTEMLAMIEQLRVEPDQPAKIVVDEASGTVVIGKNVRIDTVAVAQGNLSVKIRPKTEVYMPGPLAPDTAVPVVVQEDEVAVEEEETQLAVMERGATLQELVDGLNALGVSPRDLISILQTIKVAGALQADIEAR